MINHKYKIIFIHIPRTGGTSIEKCIAGKNWWNIHPPSKHLTAHLAKKEYTKYWDDYFKFAFVRNPWDRMVSLLKHGSFYGVKFNFNDKLLMNEYFDDYDKIEYDKRFSHLNQFKDFTSKKNSIYQNIIGDEMNFVGKFENLQEDFNTVCDKIGIPQQRLPHIEKLHKRRHYTEYYDDETREIVAQKYARDIEYFGYKFGE